MVDNITEVDSTQFASDAYVELSKYVAKTRAYPSLLDGLKTVYRRVIYANRGTSKFTKSASGVGEAIKYHSHSDGAIYGALVTLTCEFGAFPVFDGQGNFGDRFNEAAAARYTEFKMSDKGKYVYTDLIEYSDFIQGDIGLEEPEYIPSMIPYALLEGSTSIPVGLPSPSIPPIDLLGLIDYYISKLEGVTPEVPLPDFGGVLLDQSKESSDRVLLSGEGRLHFKSSIRIEDDSIVLSELPPEFYIHRITNKLEEYIEREIIDYSDESTSDPRYVFRINDMSYFSEIYSIIDHMTTTSRYYNMYFEYRGQVYSCGLEFVVDNSLEYYKKCTRRYLRSEISRVNSQLEVFRAINYMKSSNLVSQLNAMSTDEVIHELVSHEFSEETSKKVVQKPISYLTRSHNAEMRSLETSLREFSYNLDHLEDYLIKRYQELRSRVLPFYNSRSHTKLVGDTKSNKARIQDGKVLIDSRGSVDFNSTLYGVYNDREITVFSNLTKQSAAILDPSETYQHVFSDTSQYYVIVYSDTEGLEGDHIYVGSRDDLESDIRSAKFKRIDGFHSTQYYEFDHKDVEVIYNDNSSKFIDLTGYMKSRYSYPTWVYRGSILDIKSTKY